jgi:hypothetical protein
MVDVRVEGITLGAIDEADHQVDGAPPLIADVESYLHATNVSAIALQNIIGLRPGAVVPWERAPLTARVAQSVSCHCAHGSLMTRTDWCRRIVLAPSRQSNLCGGLGRGSASGTVEQRRAGGSGLRDWDEITASYLGFA